MPLSPAFATIHARASAWEAEVAARTATRVAVVTGRQLKAAVAPAVRAAVKVSGWYACDSMSDQVQGQKQGSGFVSRVRFGD